MSVSKILQRAGIISVMVCFIASCHRYHPPYNNFKPFTGLVPTGQNQLIKPYLGSEKALIRELASKDIQYVRYGDTRTLIVPTDRYYVFESPHLNQLCYPGLVDIIQMLRRYPDSTIYLAGFTDNVGSRFAKNHLTQARAETMLSFLWANGISAQLLHAEGYGEKNPVADNQLIHGSAQNRRLEIQWFQNPKTQRMCCLVEK